jgi:hypothetical protein
MKKGSATDPDFRGSLVGPQRSVKQRVVAVTALVFSAMVGLIAAWWLSLSSCLPEYASMTSETTDRGNATVARRLVAIGAYPWQGKIYDWSGREVLFFEVGKISGAQPGGMILREAQKWLDDWRVHHPVIEVRHRWVEGEFIPQ